MTIGIYGLGRFGTFWGSKIAEYGVGRGWTVAGFSRSSNRQIPSSMVRVDEEALFECDVVILCTAINSVEEVISNNSDRIKPGTVIMDTCSVKVHPAGVMDKHLAPGVEILGTHPMFGPDSGKSGIDGLPIVISPIRCTGETRDFWISVFKAMGLEVNLMTPDEHDLEAAFTQGVTHFIGRVLGLLELKESAIATVGYRELIKIVEQTCNDPVQLFLDLQKYNPHTEEMRLKLKSALDETLKQI